MRRRVVPAVAAVVVAAVLSSIGGASPPAANASQPTWTVPAQFISKLYTESLGIAPPTTQWANIQNYYLTNACSAANLKTWGKDVYKSTDFAATYPIPDTNPGRHTYASRATALFRGALNREATQGEMDSIYVTLRDTTQTAANLQAVWNNVVDNVFDGTSFATFAGTICNTSSTKKDPAAYGWNTDQHWVPTAAVSTACGMSGPGLTRASLQAALDGAPANGTVTLAQNAFVYLDAQLVIPPGKTLRTCGPTESASLPDPNRTRYALQARLIRSWDKSVWPAKTWPYAPTGLTGPADIPTIRLTTGAKLEKVWVDGNRNLSANNCSYTGYPSLDRMCSNVVFVNQLCPGQTPTAAPNCPVNTALRNSRIDNSGGGTMIASYGAQAGAYCRGWNYIENNLVVGYASSHFPDPWGRGAWQDGMTVGCEKTQVLDNHVVDATDVPIIIWRPCVSNESTCYNTYTDNRVQMSKVERNTVIAAGNSNWGHVWQTTGESTFSNSPIADFTGSTIKDNHLFTSVAATTHALVVLGARTIGATVAGVSHPDWTTRGKGATVTNNDTSGQIAYVNVAVIHSAMKDTNLSGNHFDLTRVAFAGVGGLTSTFPGWRCGAGWLTNNQRAPIISEVSSDQGVTYWANGTLGPNDSTTTLDMGATYTSGGVENGCMRLDV